ncbi:MAG: choice-of-anchor D domain-containing protein, partial [Limisphaerales bacterium]
ANDSAQVFISSSLDGGETFEDVLVSDVAFLPAPIPGLAGGYSGDYIGISALNGIVWPCWNDNRTGIHQAYTSRIIFLEVGSPPKISVSPDTLDFGEVFLGYPETLSVNIRNLGFPDTLSVSGIASDNSDFAPEAATLSLPGGSSQKVKIAFNPSGVGPVTANLTISSNDTANPSVTVLLKGDGLIAPDISVSPDSFKVDLFTGEIKVETLIVSNSTGGSDLDFDLSVESNSALALKTRVLEKQKPESGGLPPYKPLKAWKDYRESVTTGVQPSSQPMLLPLPIVVQDPAGDGGVVDITVLRGAGNGGLLQVQMELATTIVPSNFGGYLSLDIDQNPATGVSPSFGNPNQDIGAEYEFLLFSLSSGVVNLYNAITGSFIGSYPVTIGTNTLTFSTPLTDLGNDDGKMDVTGVIGDAFGPTDWFPDSGHGTIGAINFLSVNPDSATIPAGDSMAVEVTFDATGIPGGHFFASILISSNDPDEPVDTVPAHLHVIGAPNIVLSPDTLDFGDAFVTYPDTLTLTVSNNGTDLLEVTGMAIDNPRFSVLDTTVFNVPPGDSQNVRVQFLPLAVGLDSGILSIASTDSTDPTVYVQLLGNGIHFPVMEVAPDSLAFTLLEGDSATATMTISNTGLGTLTFDVFHRFLSLPVLSANKALAIDSSIRILTISFDSLSISNPLLDSLQLPYTLVNTSQFDTINLANFDLFFVGTTGFVQPLINRSADIAAFLQAGGGIVALYETAFNAWQWLPLSVTQTVGLCNELIHVVDSTHPAMDSLTDAGLSNWGCSYHGVFTAFDSSLQALAVGVEAGNQPVILAGEPLGGRLYITGTDNENHMYRHEAITMIGKAIAWAGRGANWLFEEPDSGTVLPGGGVDVSIKVKTDQLDGGTFSANILISSNDPANRQDTVPVRLRVIGAPNIVLSP